MNTHSQRLCSLMVVCLLTTTTVAGDSTQSPIHKGNSHKTMLIAGVSLLLGAGFCAWKLMNHYNRNALPKNVPAVLADNRVNPVELPKTLHEVEISHGLLTLQQGNDPSLRVFTTDSELCIDQAAHLSAHRLRLHHPSALRYILTLTQIPKVLVASGDSTIDVDETTADTLELRTRDSSKINIKNLTINTLLSVHRTGSSTITTGGKWNVDVSPNRFEMRGKDGSTRLTKHNQQETVLKIIASQGTSFGVSVD